MITPELIGYVSGEFAKGRTREQIHADLVAEGGWTGDDIDEAFKTVVVPMQSYTPPKASTQNIETPAVKKSKAQSFWHNLIFVVVGLLCVTSWYFYSLPKANFWNSYVNRLEESSMQSLNSSVSSLENVYIKSWNSLRDVSVNSWNSSISAFKNISIPSFNLAGIFSKNKVSDNPVVVQNTQIVNVVKDCGTTNSPDLKNKNTYENDSTLKCLGNAVLLCESAKAVLKDALFPTNFEVIKNSGSCSFKLSYGADSTLTDITNKKLALQYISCPLNVVKAMDDSNPSSPVFKNPDTTDMGKYASQVYFYGTLGLFIENNVDQNKIQSLGCSGPYINSVVASYQKSAVK